MLKWFVDCKIAEAALNNPKRLIEEEEIEVQSELLPDATIDENVEVNAIKKYFTADAWLLVEDVMAQKRKNPVFTCKLCSQNLSTSLSIVCDHCLTWYHITCVGLKQAPKVHYWYCRDCHKSPQII